MRSDVAGDKSVYQHVGSARNNGRVVVLSQKTEEKDALNVLDADRRELALTIKTPEPLRKACGSRSSPSAIERGDSARSWPATRRSAFARSRL
jgi:hypothetical protein